MKYGDLWIILGVVSAIMGVGSLLDGNQVSSARSAFRRSVNALNGYFGKFLATVTSITDSFHEKGSFGRKSVLSVWALAIVFVSVRFGHSLQEAFWNRIGSGILSACANFAFALFPFAVGLAVWAAAILISFAFSAVLALFAVAAYPIVSNPYRLLWFRVSCFAVLVVGQLLQLSVISDVPVW